MFVFYFDDGRKIVGFRDWDPLYPFENMFEGEVEFLLILISSRLDIEC